MPALRKLLKVVLAGLLVLAWTADSGAEYFRHRQSDIDPGIFRIEEKKYLGNKIDPDLMIVATDGRAFAFRELLGKPLVLVLSYYTCDGSCSAVNGEVKALLEQVKRLEMGKDYRVLTLSFDKNDTLETLKKFQEVTRLSESLVPGWTFGVFQDGERIEEITKQVLGFRFFWTPQDRIFYHPNVMIVLTGDGRVSRYVYLLTNSKTDAELALLDAKQGNFKPGEVIDFAISLCYSYNFKEGRYTWNIPLFVGAGSFLLGILLLIGSVLFYRKRKKTEV
ncbi:MAG: SCO family protein [Magnetococcales bacterium]|nr:SCO family protein [Magnetococcales bacterium]